MQCTLRTSRTVSPARCTGYPSWVLGAEPAPRAPRNRHGGGRRSRELWGRRLWGRRLAGSRYRVGAGSLVLFGFRAPDIGDQGHWGRRLTGPCPNRPLGRSFEAREPSPNGQKWLFSAPNGVSRPRNRRLTGPCPNGSLGDGSSGIPEGRFSLNRQRSRPVPTTLRERGGLQLRDCSLVSRKEQCG